MVCGIINTTTTACHLSSALIILSHCLLPKDIPLDHAPDPFFRSLRKFLVEQQQASSAAHEQQPLDPTLLYKQLQRTIGVDPNELGDAISALLRILQELSSSLLGSFLEATIHSGQVSSRLEAGKRQKSLKTRAMACPFVVEGTQTTLLECIQTAFAPNEVHGYKWTTDNAGTDDQVIQGEDSSHEKTFKTLVAHKLPFVWLIQVNRFTVKDGRPVPRENSVNVPRQFDTTTLGHPYKYKLMGGILHVSDDDVDDPDEEDGHYVAMVASQEEDDWYHLVDDDIVTRVDADAALNLLSGAKNKVTERGTEMRGVLLVYQRLGPNKAVDEIVSSIREELRLQEVNWSDPESLVGRRLSVKWASDKYYNGVVASFDADSGKHQVRYDDGDVKHYRLQKKTIKWL